MNAPKKYAKSEIVEAMQWFDTVENREAFATWFEDNGNVFETFGNVVCLDWDQAEEGEWIVLDEDGDFYSLSDFNFRAQYEVAS